MWILNLNRSPRRPLTRSRLHRGQTRASNRKPMYFVISVSTSEWSVTGIDLLSESHPPPVHRPFSANASLEGAAAREHPPTYSGTGTGDPAPTATSTARRSSSNANVYSSPDQTKLMTSALGNPSATSALSYYQHHPGQHTTGLAGVAANDCSGFDVRPM
ncbi:hypothetical protein H4Q26_009669 [Puccinia striiformis f. sp. tritici PST-130]|nr:hypothetical protein H4Q26_009669 [Puccinia striiformis f. sp. tritici PST-130]